MNKTALDGLVTNGDIKSYELMTLDEDGDRIAVSGKGMRETEQVLITFPSGRKLIVNTSCSGCRENTCLSFVTLDVAAL